MNRRSCPGRMYLTGAIKTVDSPGGATNYVAVIRQRRCRKCSCVRDDEPLHFLRDHDDKQPMVGDATKRWAAGGI